MATIPIAMDAALSGLAGQRNGRARASAPGQRRDAAASGGHHDACRGHRRPRGGRRRFRRCSIASARTCDSSGSGRRCSPAPKWRCSGRRRLARRPDAAASRRRRRRARPARAVVRVREVRRRFSVPMPNRAAAGRAGGRGRGGASGPALKLSREPALGALAATRPAIWASARRTCWPGSSGRASQAPRLRHAADAPPSRLRFDAGKEVYQNLCMACHQLDGRGREKVAPTLLGSEFALGPAEVPVRILINGKEGPVGLMPPLGSVLNDDQIAAVLTYIRREWGQTGSPIDPATVRQVRTATAERARPWTADELAKIAGGRQ